MPALAEIQAGIRAALLQGESDRVARMLSGAAHPERRLAIHQRHYDASLTRALIERFPATVWLVGAELVADAARSFIREHPPATPCIAEYGEDFPAYLAAHPGAAPLLYLREFADIEWHLGRLSLATDESANVQRLHVHWNLDELIGVYLTDSAPDRFSLREEDLWLELRGLRGEIWISRSSSSPAASA